MSEDDRIPMVDTGREGFAVPRDNRPQLPEPIPVKLLAVEDMHLPAPAGSEPRLDHFYVDLLKFQRDSQAAGVVYRAENVRLHFKMMSEPIVNRHLRPMGIIVPSLADAEQTLVEAELHYERQRGVTPGSEMLVLMDPAGNWVQIMEAPQIR